MTFFVPSVAKSSHPSGLLLPLDNPAEIAQAETEAIAIVVAKYLAKRPSRRSAPFTHAWAIKLHRDMFGAVWEWAGELSWDQPTAQTSFQPLRGALGKQAFQKLFADLHLSHEQGTELTEQTTWLYHRALELRPFKDGNARWARMLATIWAKQHER